VLAGRLVAGRLLRLGTLLAPESFLHLDSALSEVADPVGEDAGSGHALDDGAGGASVRNGVVAWRRDLLAWFVLFSIRHFSSLARDPVAGERSGEVGRFWPMRLFAAVRLGGTPSPRARRRRLVLEDDVGGRVEQRRLRGLRLQPPVDVAVMREAEGEQVGGKFTARLPVEAMVNDVRPPRAPGPLTEASASSLYPEPEAVPGGVAGAPLPDGRILAGMPPA
jgi:hypothetical protein